MKVGLPGVSCPTEITPEQENEVTNLEFCWFYNFRVETLLCPDQVMLLEKRIENWP